MATPLPNSAHGDQLISAKARGTARFFERPSYVTRLHFGLQLAQDSQPGREDSASASWNRDLSSGPGPELAYLELQMRRLKTSQASDRRPSPLSQDEVHQN